MSPTHFAEKSQDKVEEMTGRGVDFKGGSKLLAVIGDEVLYKESCYVQHISSLHKTLYLTKIY